MVAGRGEAAAQKSVWKPSLFLLFQTASLEAKIGVAGDAGAEPRGPQKPLGEELILCAHERTWLAGLAGVCAGSAQARNI